MKNGIKIPSSWDEVSIGEFIELSKLDIKSFENDVEYYIHMLRIFGNDNLQDIFEYVKVSDIEKINNSLTFLQQPPTKDGNMKVELNGKTFKMIENMNEITIGEYVSIETLIEKYEANNITAIPIILSVLLRPVGEEFDSNLCESRIELFKDELSIQEVVSMSDFFLNGAK